LDPSSVGLETERRVVPVSEDLRDQAGQHAARPDLDEQAGAGLIHRLDLCPELDRRSKLAGEAGTDLLDRGRVRSGSRVRPDRHRGRGELQICDLLRESFVRFAHAWAVEGTGDGEAPDGQASLAETQAGVVELRRRAGNHDLT